jgi:KipI family sensor histidine kinase inhibitor
VDAPPRILPFGDAALLVELGDAATIAAARRARRVAAVIEQAASADVDVVPAGMGVPRPGAASVLVPWDVRRTDADEVAAWLAGVLDKPATEDDLADAPLAPARLHEIRVRYDGPDLEAVASETGRTAADVVGLHAGREYEVLFLGFAPGFAYLGELDPALVVPRLATPRTHVPAGSVAIAGAMTAVYPHPTAGGWRLLGHTDATLWDPSLDPPARLAPGDRVRFVPS